jgi:hypothetical protein
MKASRKFLLPLTALFFGLLLVPKAALAAGGATNCPPEPATDTAIASGELYAGTNCALHTGDVDSFVFSANDGDTYQSILAYQGGANGSCMVLLDPNGKQIFPNTSSPNNCTSNGDLVVPQTLTVTGKYTINLTQQGGGSGGDYSLSLERINPFPSDAKQATLAHAIAGTFDPANAQIAYTFAGFTTGTYFVSVSYTGGANGTCAYLYYPGSATPRPSPDQGCTSNGVFQFTFTPPENDTYMVLLTGEGDGSGGDYSFEVSCYSGTCPIKEPTTTTLTSSSNPSGDGQPVTFTAVVSSSGGAPPNGETVSFMNGKTVLGTGTLSSGKATFPDSKLTAGATTSVTAVYPGDSNFLASTSNVVKQVVYGPCTLTDSLTYNATTGTLTMKFTVGNTVATTWNAWLTDQNNIESLFSIAQSITNPPVVVSKTASLSKEGTVGVLSTLTTSTKGIFCSSYAQINTGTP